MVALGWLEPIFSTTTTKTTTTTTTRKLIYISDEMCAFRDQRFFYSSSRASLEKDQMNARCSWELRIYLQTFSIVRFAECSSWRSISFRRPVANSLLSPGHETRFPSIWFRTLSSFCSVLPPFLAWRQYEQKYHPIRMEFMTLVEHIIIWILMSVDTICKSTPIHMCVCVCVLCLLLLLPKCAHIRIFECVSHRCECRR